MGYATTRTRSYEPSVKSVKSVVPHSLPRPPTRRGASSSPLWLASGYWWSCGREWKTTDFTDFTDFTDPAPRNPRPPDRPPFLQRHRCAGKRRAADPGPRQPPGSGPTGRPPSEHGSPVGVGAVAIIEATADPDLLAR